MADTSVAERKTVLAGFHGGSAKVRLTPALPATRVSLRAGPMPLPAFRSRSVSSFRQSRRRPPPPRAARPSGSVRTNGS